MILFSVFAISGHFLTAAMAQVPVINYEPTCRDSGTAGLGLKDDRAICMQDEAAARAEVAHKWSEFSASGRATCTRLSTSNGVGSYVELLTCLEMDRDARKLDKGADAGIGAMELPGERGRAAEPPLRTGQVQRRPAPVELAAPEAKPAANTAAPGILSRFLGIFCPPGKALPNCPAAGP
jgi:hypothetical protein